VDLSGVGLCPEETVQAFAKGRVFGEFPCVWIEGVAMQGSMVECGPVLGTLGGKEGMVTAGPAMLLACACLHGGSDDRGQRQQRLGMVVHGHGSIIRKGVSP